MYAELFPKIDSFTIVLTVNNRLARYLQIEYAKWQQGQGHQIFQTPHVLPLNTWLTQVISIEGLGIVLSPLQTQSLWEQIISNSPLSHDLLRTEDTAIEVSKAYELALQWQLNIEELVLSECPDVQAFSTWAQSFERTCSENNWLAPAHLIDMISAEKFNSNQIFYFIGFDNLSPLLKKLFAIIGEKCQVEEYNPTKINQHIQRVQYLQTESELQRMAAWAYERYQETHSTIGCVVPDLTNKREIVSRIFQETFSDKESYNISAAIPLSQYPLVKAALNCMKLAMGEKNWQLISTILRSPFIKGGQSEISSRALLDHHLRNFGELEISIDSILNLTDHCPILRQQLSQLPECPEQMSCQDWRSYFIEVLRIFGWPGDRSLDREEYQTTQRLLTALDEFTQLKLFYDALDAESAFRLLNSVINRILYQPKRKPARIQILGLLEAGGLSFDYLWVQGLDDKTLPAPLKPNPYLPVLLQREKKMPHAHADHEWQYAKNIFERLISSHSTVILSYPIHEDDRELSPSPLMAGIPLTEFEPTPVKSHTITLLETLVDNQAPIVNNKEKLGGSYLFKAQALCPFKAFAEVRLKADTPCEPTQGLSSRDRGNILHEILAVIWTELQSSEKLQGVDEKWISEKIETVLWRFSKFQPITLTPSFIPLETRRLTRLIKEWLEIEKQRSPFKVIECEQKHTVTINGMTLNLRTDRIDECANGEKIIIDYKTGNISVSSWEGDRPEEPQMLLYCVTNPHTEGIAFAQIKANKMQYQGITRSELLPKVSSDSEWESRVTQWQEVLTSLSDDFLKGNAAVDPKKGHLTCEYCQLQTFCRIYQESNHE